MRMTKLFFGLLASSAALAGCTVSNGVDRDVRTNTTETQNLLAQARAPKAADLSPVKVNNDVYVGTKSVRNENGDALPSKFEKQNGIVIVDPTPRTLAEIAAFLTEKTHIPVVVAAAPPAGSTAPTPAPAPAPVPQPIAQPQSGQLAPGPIPAGFPSSQLDQALQQIATAPANAVPGAMLTASSSYSSSGAMSLKYSGSLSGLLDIVAAHFNVSWTYQRGRITLDTTVTRTFDVPALATSTGLNFKLGTSGDQNGGTASNQSTTDFFAELQTGLSALVSGGSFSINKVSGTVTVTGNPATVARVQEYLQTLNSRMSKQVTLDVRVYSVSLRDSEGLNFDLGAVLKEAATYGLNLGGKGDFSSVSNTGVGTTLGWALLDDSNLTGSKATLQALSQRGNVSEVTSSVVQTLNGQPVPIQVGVDREYIKSIEKTTDTNGNSTYTNTTGEISSGFGMQLSPRVESNGDVLLQYALDISQLTGSTDGFDVQTINGNPIQLKRVARRNFLQQARIPHQNTLVLAGFEQTRATTSKSGAGHPDFALFGGGHTSSQEKEVLVIMITPTVIDKQ